MTRVLLSAFRPPSRPVVVASAKREMSPGVTDAPALPLGLLQFGNNVVSLVNQQLVEGGAARWVENQA